MSFKDIEALKIGKIIEVSGSSITIELEDSLLNLTKSYRGKVYSIGQVSSVIKILFGRKLLFASVKSLRLKTEVEIEGQKISLGDDQRVLEADLIGEGTWSDSERKLNFSRGVEQYPLPLQHAYIMTQTELTYFYQSIKIETNEYDSTIEIGNYTSTNQSCRIDADKLVGQHSAILGSTGTGKSGTVASIIHAILSSETAKHPRIIMIDPHGEYSKAFKGISTTYTIGELEDEIDLGTEVDDEIKRGNLNLPYWIMDSDELRSLLIGKTEREATSQNNIIYEALSYARMVEAGIVKTLGDDPKGGQVAELCEGKTEKDRLSFNRDRPLPFKLKEFILHINKVQGRNLGNTTRLSASNRKSHDSILRKIDVLRANPQLKFIFKEYEDGENNLNKILLQFLGGSEDDEKNIKIVDTSGLPNEIAGILVALISRLIFQYKVRQTRNEREKEPVLLVYEEAHLYVPNRGEAQFKEAQEAIRRIAKEGRKYGLGLMLVSQRPADLESTVLSQCSTWVVLRLTNHTDQSHVANFIPDNLSGLLSLLPTLTRREAIVVGEAISLPSRIKITELEKDKLPDSGDIQFLKGWRNQYNTEEQIGSVISRW